MDSQNDGRMECRRIEINVISASDLEEVRERSRMKVYAEVSIADHDETKRRTPVDRQNKTNPAWNYTIRYTVGERALHQEGVMLVVKLFCKRKLGHLYIGEVYTSIKQLYDQGQANGGGGGAILTYPVQRGSAVSQGELILSCMFREQVRIQEPALWRRLLRQGTAILLRYSVREFGILFFVGSDDDWVAD